MNPCFLVKANTCPVSYTHLDVYKRQEIKRRKDILLRSRHSQPSANKTVSAVHSTKIKTPTEAQKKAAIYRKAVADKAKRQQAARTAVRTKNIARKSAHEARKTAQMMTRFARRIIEAGRALAGSIGAAGSAVLIIVIMCTLFGAAFYFFGDDTSSYVPVSPEVEAYTPVIQKYADEYGIPQYTELINCLLYTSFTTASAVNVLPRPTLSARIQPLYFSSLLMIARTASFWKL